MPEQAKGRCRPDWLQLFRCFHIANDPVKVWLGLVALAVMLLVLLVELGVLLEVRRMSGEETSRDALNALRRGDVVGVTRAIGKYCGRTRDDLRLELGNIRASLGGPGLMAALERASTLKEVLPWALGTLLLLWLPWAYFGGAISRSAAVELAGGERLTAAEARSFVSLRYGSYLWAPMALFLVIVALILCTVLIGVAAAHLLSAGAFVAGILFSLYLGVVVKQKRRSGAPGVAVSSAGFVVTVAAAWWLWDVRVLWLWRVALVLAFPLALLLGLAAVLGALVLLFGRGMMTATISFEGTEAFDAISRAGDYVLKRPWRLLFYWLVGVAYGGACAVFVASLAGAAFLVALVAVWTGFGASFREMYGLVFSFGRPATFTEWLPAFLLGALVSIVGGLVAGWCLAFVQSYRTICYALIRKSVDLADVSEVYQELDRTADGPSA